ncbi:MAG: glutaredoxin family protein [Xanthomonadales bacterium]|nr:glutaredoxin family protein [Xanthomonadales bacterium]
MSLILYQRDDCQLCDEAIALLVAASAPDFSSIWIDGDRALESRYGARVPVLLHAGSGRELDWPFDEVAIRRFLGESR